MSPYTAIYPSCSPVAQCVECGVQQQFHTKSAVPYSADRDHPFVAVTIADISPEDLDTAALVSEIHRSPNDARVEACREALRSRMVVVTGVDWESLAWSLAS